MEMETIEKQSIISNVNNIEAWFTKRAQNFVQRTSHGSFTRKIYPDDIRMEFKNLAMELEFKDRKVLKMWLDNRAEIFIESASKGSHDASIATNIIETEFKILAKEYIAMAYGFESLRFA